MFYKSKYDYQKEPRADVHTTIRKDLYKKLKSTSIDIEEHSTKCLDVIIDMVLNNKELYNEFRNRIRLY
jgi:hypothetical protein